MDVERTLPYRVSYGFHEVESGLLAGTTGWTGLMGSLMESSTVLRDYRKLGAGLVARHETLRMGTFEIVIETVSLEHPDALDDAVFDPPDSIRKLVEERAGEGR